MTTVRAIMIDPVERTIKEIAYNTDSYKNIYPLIHADMFTTVNLMEDGDAVFIDDEGRINGQGEKYGGFRLLGDPDTSKGYDLAGYGLMLGCDDNGDTDSLKATLAWVKEHVQWLEPAWFVSNPAPPMEFVTF